MLEIYFVLLLIYLLWRYFAKPNGYPPGYWGFPLIGYIPLNKKKNITERLLEIRKKNGNSPVVSWRMGTRLVVFLFDGKMIREAFTGKDFIYRPPMRIIGFLGNKNVGLARCNGASWQQSRRFTLHHLRDLGMGKSSLLPVIHEEAIEIMKTLKSEAGRPAPIPESLVMGPLNIIWQMIASKRYTIEDEELQRFLYLLKEFEPQVDKVTVADFMPWLPFVTPSFILKKIVDFELVQQFDKHLRDLLMNMVKAHEKKLDINNPKDYIDSYLIEIKKQENDPEPLFTYENLVVTIGDLYRAGSDTVTTTFKWILLYLTKYPEIQKRLQEEVDEVLPKWTLATLEDKLRLPFTEAVIHEVHRHASFIKFGIMHMAVRDTQLGGYTIPKDAIMCPAAFFVNRDPKYWDSPDEFLPERFLDANGKFVQPKEGFQPFGIGKRQCIGEALARMTLFVFLTTVVQHLNLAVPPGKTVDLTPLPISFVNAPNVNQDFLITTR